MTERKVLTLKCIRCGDTHHREVGDPYQPMLCGDCFSKGLEIMFSEEWPYPKYSRWERRWMKTPNNHPTLVALRAAWGEMEAGMRLAQ